VKWLGYVRKSVKSLHLPGEIGKRQKQQHVIDLAADIRELGEEPINAPVFDKAGQIIAGRDRMAALLLNKAKRCWIRVADATEQERSDLEVSENLYRRVDNRQEMIARRVRRVVEQIAATRKDKRTNVPLGTARQIKSQALKKVAREAGITPAAVRKAEQRERAKDKGEIAGSSPALTGDGERGESGKLSPASLAPPAPPCPVDAFGVETSPAFRSRMSEIQGVLEMINRHLINAQTELVKLKAMEFPGALWQRLKADIHSAAYNVRAAKPALVCLYCRDPDGTALLRDHCNGCSKLGYLTEEQRAMVPRELVTKGAAPVTAAPAEGRRYYAGSHAAGLDRAEQAARKATLRIEDGAGNPIDVTKEDPPSLPLPLEPFDDTEADEETF
jgi:hypothetical protein